MGGEVATATRTRCCYWMICNVDCPHSNVRVLRTRCSGRAWIADGYGYGVVCFKRSLLNFLKYAENRWLDKYCRIGLCLEEPRSAIVLLPRAERTLPTPPNPKYKRTCRPPIRPVPPPPSASPPSPAQDPPRPVLLESLSSYPPRILILLFSYSPILLFSYPLSPAFI
jgi:hypothetical protein